MVSSFSWLGCRPVTAEITGSSPVGTAVSLVVYIGVNTPMIEGGGCRFESYQDCKWCIERTGV
jgi:hypothetical protein